MGRIVLVAAVCALFACSSRAEAQCGELLKGGVFETTSFSSSSTSTQSFMNWLRSHHSDLSTRDTGGGLSIPVIGSLNGSDKQYRDIESDYAASQSGSSSASQHLAAHIRSVSSALAPAGRSSAVREGSC